MRGFVTGGFSTFSTGFSTGKTEKPLDKQGFIKGYQKNHQFFYTAVENNLVYRTPLKFHLRREDPGMSTGNICLRYGTIYAEIVLTFPA